MVQKGKKFVILRCQSKKNFVTRLLGLLFGHPGFDQNSGEVELEGVGLHRQQEEDVPEGGHGVTLKFVKQIKISTIIVQ
jgi:hypothetical protein